MSVFRPSARALGPDGREWEIYAYRVKLPERRGPAGTVFDDSPRVVGLACSGVYWLAAGVVHALARIFVDIPAAAVRALASDEWTVEAISFAPYRRSYTYTTTRELQGQVLAQVEGAIARGETPHPRNATLVGTDN